MHRQLGACALVDVETSGLSPAQHRMLSITVITVEETGAVSGEFHTLLDPGCDPGPVHIHGLTREKLSGAPRFEDVGPTLEGLLRDRVMVAHNASFDYGFLAREFRRWGTVLPVARRLCTLALARRVDPPTPDRRLGSLAAHYGVVQRHAHDSLDDTRVLAGVLGGLLDDARRMGIDLPVLGCSPAPGPFTPTRIGPKPPCPYTNPGRFRPGEPLVQGMAVAITGATRLPRAELTARGDAAGLNVVGSVGRHTGLLVADRAHGDSRKFRAALGFGIPVITEQEFVDLLSTVRPGTMRGGPAARPAPRQNGRARSGPLAGQRILVLGGRHDEAAAARTRIVELGGSAAVNLSATVTGVLALGNARADRRYPRIVELRLPLFGPDLLTGSGRPSGTAPPTASAPLPGSPDIPASSSPVAGAPADIDPVPTPAHDEPTTLARGQVVDLPIEDSGHEWTFHIAWAQTTSVAVDPVAFVLDDTEQVTADEDFVFYNQPQNDCVLLGSDAPNEHTVTVRLDTAPEHCRRIVLAAAIDSRLTGAGATTFADVGAIEIEAAPSADAATIARTTLDAATTEKTLLLLEIYLRGDTWRLRSLGQGYETDLAALATGFGVRLAE